MIKDGKRSAREIDKELFGRAREQKWQQVEEREEARRADEEVDVELDKF